MATGVPVVSSVRGGVSRAQQHPGGENSGGSQADEAGVVSPVHGGSLSMAARAGVSRLRPSPVVTVPPGFRDGTPVPGVPAHSVDPDVPDRGHKCSPLRWIAWLG
jgi:hypothetical protein